MTGDEQTGAGDDATDGQTSTCNGVAGQATTRNEVTDHVPESVHETEEVNESADEHTVGTRDDCHLRDLEVGAGCTEIWEHLAERRRESE